MDILKEKQWRQIEISKPPGSALIAALLECCSCRTRCHKFHIVVCIHQRLKIYLGATDKPCGVRTVANPKQLLNGT